MIEYGKKFKVGDKVVRYSNQNNYNCNINIGLTGTYKGNHKDYVGRYDKYCAVEWNNFNNGHSCDGICKEDTGEWIEEFDLKLIEQKSKNIVVDYKPGTSIMNHIKNILKKENDKERVKWLQTFERCVLPVDVRDMIEEALTSVLRADMYEKWGINENFEKGLTNSILLYGPPGTGKTMVSESIAAILGMNLMKISSGDLQSNIPGQTERNITEIFEQAKKKDCVMLLDECDSILYDRDNVGAIMSAEINTLLTEIENFKGVIILTTNRLHKLDKALQRRIVAKIELPKPPKTARIIIWEKLVPKQMPLSKDVDFKELGEADLTGGEIKNAILLAARKAIAKNMDEVTMTNFRSAILSIEESKNDFEGCHPDYGEFNMETGSLNKSLEIKKVKEVENGRNKT
jgi:SpoVK/Ycf46/Vps4 family AAA+-type ATPase